MGTKNYRHFAFTLVELLVVISIIAILAAIAIMYLRGQLFKGNDARRKADITRIKIAVEEYEKDHDCYPLPQLLVCTPGTGLRPYLDKIPCDPVTNASYIYEVEDSACPSWYRIYADLEFSQDIDINPGIGPNSAFNYYSGSANAPIPEASAVPSGGTGGASGYYGCRSGACVPINWDPSRPGPECDPSFQNSSCYGWCTPSTPDCIPW